MVCSKSRADRPACFLRQAQATRHQRPPEPDLPETDGLVSPSAGYLQGKPLKTLVKLSR